MDMVKKLEKATENLLKLLNDYDNDEKERMMVIDDITGLLDERDGIITGLQNRPLEPNPKLVEMEKEIQEKLQSLYGAIRGDLQRTRQKHHQKQYINPYGKTRRDGMYLDRKG